MKKETHSHKAGFVNIVGMPNVGKSTLINKLLGQKLVIATPKVQTTRHRILGILNDENYQIVFSDTPGFVQDPANKMHEKMNEYVTSSYEDADVFLYVTELNASEHTHEPFENILTQTEIPVFVVVNKVDLTKKEEEVIDFCQKIKAMFPNTTIYGISALYGFNKEALLHDILELLPASPPFYSKEDSSDRSVRFFVSEMIREQVLLQYKQEIPYVVQVDIEQYIEEEKIDKIQATIYVERPTQKSILIGKNGSSIKELGTKARKEIEQFIDKKVYLELFVKVKEKWRNNDQTLKQFGYE